MLLHPNKAYAWRPSLTLLAVIPFHFAEVNSTPLRRVDSWSSAEACLRMCGRFDAAAGIQDPGPKFLPRASITDHSHPGLKLGSDIQVVHLKHPSHAMLLQR